jgi:hypothetical protein
LVSYVLVKSYVSSLNISPIDPINIEELNRISIETALAPLKKSVSELETYTRKQFAAVRDEFKSIRDSEVTTESTATIETTPAKTNTPAPVKPVNDSYIDRLAELVGSGMTTKEIAENLTAEGFTNTKGGDLTRKSIESKLDSNQDLKQIYDNAPTSADSLPL